MRPIDRILLLCKERGVKQAYINDLIGGYRGKVTDWKMNRSSPTEEEQRIIAEFFHVTPSYIKGEEETTAPDEERSHAKREAIARAMNALDGLNDAEIQEVLNYAKYVVSQRKQ